MSAYGNSGAPGKLGQSYPVKRYSASPKRPNQRSLRLLERLGFSPATPQECERIGIEADEVLMIRDIIGMAEGR